MTEEIKLIKSILVALNYAVNKSESVKDRDVYANAIEDAAYLGSIIEEFDSQLKALQDINASASDAGSSENKTGAEWISSKCREISDQALQQFNEPKGE